MLGLPLLLSAAIRLPLILSLRESLRPKQSSYIFNRNSPIMKREAYIYILTNNGNTVLYIGVTSDLSKRIQQHKNGVFKNAFTSKYKVSKLVYYELFQDINDAIAREKQLKAGSRQKKIDLINRQNPEWIDLMIKK